MNLSDKLSPSPEIGLRIQYFSQTEYLHTVGKRSAWLHFANKVSPNVCYIFLTFTFHWQIVLAGVVSFHLIDGVGHSGNTCHRRFILLDEWKRHFSWSILFIVSAWFCVRILHKRSSRVQFNRRTGCVVRTDFHFWKYKWSAANVQKLKIFFSYNKCW